MGLRTIALLVLGASAMGCTAGASPESLDGTWVWAERTSGDDLEVRKLSFEVDDAGEIDECKYSYRDEDFDDELKFTEHRSGPCEVEIQSDGGVEVKIKVTKATVEGDGVEVSVYDDLGPHEVELVWDCTVLDEEKELECMESGGRFYQMGRD